MSDEIRPGQIWTRKDDVLTQTTIKIVCPDPFSASTWVVEVVGIVEQLLRRTESQLRAFYELREEPEG